MTYKFNFTDERFADIQMLRYRLDDFDNLTLNQKLYIYYLSEATLCGRDITTDQFGRYNLRIRRTLEAVYVNYSGERDNDEFRAFTVYLKRVWFSNGIYHHYGCEKFEPEFSEAYFRNVVLATANDIASKSDVDEYLHLPLLANETVEGLLADICHVMFNPDIMPKRVNQKAGDDLVATSACNYY